MPYVEDTAFQSPQNAHQVIWRYLDLTKLVSMLATGSLHFTRVDKLLFGDRFEGAASLGEIRRARALFGQGQMRMYLGSHGEIPLGTDEEFRRMTRERAERAQQATAVNCWHMSHYESVAMWKVYLKSDEGVAIKSSFDRLRRSFQSASSDVRIGCVRYIDYEQELSGNPFLCKRKSFDYERELRALVESETLPPVGLDIPVDVNELVEAIYTAPGCQPWVVEAVKATVIRFGFAFDVRESTIPSGPEYL